MKRGFCKINEEYKRLDNNELIEDNLGDLDIICIEDIANEIYNIGDNFEKVINFIQPIKLLIKDKKIFINIKKNFLKGGD